MAREAAAAMNMLDRYIARTLLTAVGLAMAVLVMLGFLFTFIGEQSSVGTGHYGMVEALSYSAMTLPQFALEAFPAGALIGALLGIGILARSHELTVMRVSGMSKLRLSVAVLFSAAIIIAVAMLIGEFLAQPLGELADQQKAFARSADVSFAGGGGAWIRSGDTILEVHGLSSAAEFAGMMVFKLTPDNRVASVASAARATPVGPTSWRLYDYAESKIAQDSVTSRKVPQQVLTTSAGSELLRFAVVRPSQLALRTLYQAIVYLRSNGLASEPYLIAFWGRIARMAGILAALLFALPFGFGSMRSATLSGRTTMGLTLGVVYFFMQRLVESGAQVYRVDPLLLAWVPTGLLTLAAVILIWRIR
ncbi:MAG: LPS export ABC transporter permease LptG [Steroidobacteraceae bacterium]